MASILLFACPKSIAAGNVSIKASLDSVSVIMGQKTNLHYQIVQDKNLVGNWVIGTPDPDNVIALTPNVEAEISRNDTTDLGNNRIQIDRTLIVQSYDSGVWEIPAALYVIGRDTFRSNTLNLKVMPVNVDTLKNIHPYKGIEKVPFHLFDYLPDFLVDYWWIFLIAGLVIVLMAILAIIYKRHKDGRPLITPKKPEVPPYEEAIGALNAIKESKLWESGNDKEYYTRLTDVLRRYIFRRFGINAVEMTSSDIIRTLKEHEETKTVNEQMKMILEIADFVKFAKVRPLPDDNVASLRRAVEFVEATKPVVVEPQPKNKEGNGNNSNNSNNN